MLEQSALVRRPIALRLQSSSSGSRLPQWIYIPLAAAFAVRPGSKPRTRHGGTLVDAPLVPEPTAAAEALQAPLPRIMARSAPSDAGAAIASLLSSGHGPPLPAQPGSATKPPLSPGGLRVGHPLLAVSPASSPDATPAAAAAARRRVSLDSEGASVPQPPL